MQISKCVAFVDGVTYIAVGEAVVSYSVYGRLGIFSSFPRGLSLSLVERL